MTVGAGYSVGGVPSIGVAVAASVTLLRAGLAVGRGRCAVVPVGAATPVRFRTAALGALEALHAVALLVPGVKGEQGGEGEGEQEEDQHGHHPVGYWM